MLDTPIRSTTTLLACDELVAAHTCLSDTFGLTAGSLERGPDGRVVHGELFAGDQSIWLHPSGNSYRSPRELGGVSSISEPQSMTPMPTMRTPRSTGSPSSTHRSISPTTSASRCATLRATSGTSTARSTEHGHR
jgi:hypothetical protein